MWWHYKKTSSPWARGCVRKIVLARSNDNVLLVFLNSVCATCSRKSLHSSTKVALFFYSTCWSKSFGHCTNSGIVFIFFWCDTWSIVIRQTAASHTYLIIMRDSVQWIFRYCTISHANFLFRMKRQTSPSLMEQTSHTKSFRFVKEWQCVLSLATSTS